MSVRMNPYLVFDGNAREAIRFYERALDAKVSGVMPFSTMPQSPEHPLPPGSEDRVAHAHLKVGDSDLMLSDTFPGQPLHKGNQVTVLIQTDSAEKSRRIFQALEDGGEVQMPFQETFWSPGYGSVTDKFGVTFQVTTDAAQ